MNNQPMNNQPNNVGRPNQMPMNNLNGRPKNNNSIALVFGVVGLVIFLMLAFSIGIYAIYMSTPENRVIRAITGLATNPEHTGKLNLDVKIKKEKLDIQIEAKNIVTSDNTKTDGKASVKFKGKEQPIADFESISTKDSVAYLKIGGEHLKSDSMVDMIFENMPDVGAEDVATMAAAKGIMKQSISKATSGFVDKWIKIDLNEEKDTPQVICINKLVQDKKFMKSAKEEFLNIYSENTFLKLSDKVSDPDMEKIGAEEFTIDNIAFKDFIKKSADAEYYKKIKGCSESKTSTIDGLKTDEEVDLTGTTIKIFIKGDKLAKITFAMDEVEGIEVSASYELAPITKEDRESIKIPTDSTPFDEIIKDLVGSGIPVTNLLRQPYLLESGL